MSDEDLTAALPNLHVFGRVTPQDKLRLAKLMQQRGDIVAMTGDAVNDAAALKQADIGVAMGSGSEVTKQAGKMILTDDNFGTLVTAVRLGRSTYEKIVNYVRYQMSQLLSLVLLFLTASIFNINDGIALTPLMVLFLNFFISIFPVVVIMREPALPGLMTRPPRVPEPEAGQPGVDPAVGLLRRDAVPGHPGRSGLWTWRAAGRGAQRPDDDGVRGHGPGHGPQRPGAAPGPRVAAWPSPCWLR